MIRAIGETFFFFPSGIKWFIACPAPNHRAQESRTDSKAVPSPREGENEKESSGIVRAHAKSPSLFVSTWPLTKRLSFLRGENGRCLLVAAVASAPRIRLIGRPYDGSWFRREWWEKLVSLCVVGVKSLVGPSYRFSWWMHGGGQCLLKRTWTWLLAQVPCNSDLPCTPYVHIRGVIVV